MKEVLFFNLFIMRSMNKVMLIGHLVQDPELRQTKNGKAVANFAIATNRSAKDDDGTKKEIAEFHRVVAWSKLAEIVSQYLTKGTAVFIEGRLIYNVFNDKDGNRHHSTEIVADGLNILSPKKRDDKTEQIVAV